MTESLASIIVPVYNTGTLLNRCVQSILAQTYPFFELLLVDDGSTDLSGSICDELQDTDRRILVFHQVNSGVSAARNKGLDNASGEFVLFVDSDDELPADALSVFVKAVRDSETDMVVGGFTLRFSNYDEYRVLSRNVLSSTELSALIGTDGNANLVMSTVWGKLFLRKIFEENHLRFSEEYINGEDGLLLLDYLKCCGTIRAVLSSTYICYRYEPSERVSAVSHMYPDFFEFLLAHYSTLWELMGSSHGKIAAFYMQFCNLLVIHLVRGAAYAEFFAGGELRKKLSRLVNHPLTRTAIRHYSRPSRSASLWIPLCIRLRCAALLELAVLARGRKYARQRGKNSLVRSIYRGRSEAI